MLLVVIVSSDSLSFFCCSHFNTQATVASTVSTGVVPEFSRKRVPLNPGAPYPAMEGLDRVCRPYKRDAIYPGRRRFHALPIGGLPLGRRRVLSWSSHNETSLFRDVTIVFLAAILHGYFIIVTSRYFSRVLAHIAGDYAAWRTVIVQSCFRGVVGPAPRMGYLLYRRTPRRTEAPRLQETRSSRISLSRSCRRALRCRRGPVVTH